MRSRRVRSQNDRQISGRWYRSAIEWLVGGLTAGNIAGSSRLSGAEKPTGSARLLG